MNFSNAWSSISYYPNKLLTRDKIWKFLSFKYHRSHLIFYDFPSSLFQVSSITNGSNISEKIHSDSFTEPVGNVPTILVGKRLSLNGIACNSLNDPSIFSRNFRIWRILSEGNIRNVLSFYTTRYNPWDNFSARNQLFLEIEKKRRKKKKKSEIDSLKNFKSKNQYTRNSWT